MADRSAIEWTDATWTPVKGCTRASEGCRNCYAEIMAARFSKPGQWGDGLATIVDTPQGKDHRWTGVVRFDDAELLKPLSWKKPRRIFVCSTADLFHESVPDAWIDQVFAMMARCPQHTFQVLTKRSERMRRYFEAQGRWRDDSGRSRERECLISDAANRLQEAWRKGPMGPLWDASFRESGLGSCQPGLPLPNVWLGVSAEDQARADERIPHLLAAPAAVRFVSAEPLLGPINIIDAMWASGAPADNLDSELHWLIAGGESGPGARPMHPYWARFLRDQCAAAGVPFFFKQWGAWAPLTAARPVVDGLPVTAWPNGTIGHGNAKDHGGAGTALFRGTKKIAGRLLDGVTHDGMPKLQSEPRSHS